MKTLVNPAFFTYLSINFFILLSVNSNYIYSQTCTLTGNISVSQEDVINCLNTCTCNSITITNGTIDMSNDWNLVSRGNLTITITETGELRFPDMIELYLTAGSSITITPGGQLTANGGNGSDPKIVKGTVTYTASQF